MVREITGEELAKVMESIIGDMFLNPRMEFNRGMNGPDDNVLLFSGIFKVSLDELRDPDIFIDNFKDKVKNSKFVTNALRDIQLENRDLELENRDLKHELTDANRFKTHLELEMELRHGGTIGG